MRSSLILQPASGVFLFGWPTVAALDAGDRLFTDAKPLRDQLLLFSRGERIANQAVAFAELDHLYKSAVAVTVPVIEWIGKRMMAVDAL